MGDIFHVPAIGSQFSASGRISIGDSMPRTILTAMVAILFFRNLNLPLYLSCKSNSSINVLLNALLT